MCVCVLFSLQVMEQLTDHHYEILSVPEDAAANCIYIRGPAKVDFLLHPTAEECPNSIPVSNRVCTVKQTIIKCDDRSVKLGFCHQWKTILLSIWILG